jgi:hypothetical protein
LHLILSPLRIPEQSSPMFASSPKKFAYALPFPFFLRRGYLAVMSEMQTQTERDERTGRFLAGNGGQRWPEAGIAQQARRTISAEVRGGR